MTSFALLLAAVVALAAYLVLTAPIIDDDLIDDSRN